MNAIGDFFENAGNAIKECFTGAKWDEARHSGWRSNSECAAQCNPEGSADDVKERCWCQDEVSGCFCFDLWTTFIDIIEQYCLMSRSLFCNCSRKIVLNICFYVDAMLDRIDRIRCSRLLPFFTLLVWLQCEGTSNEAMRKAQLRLGFLEWLRNKSQCAQCVMYALLLFDFLQT